MPKAPKLPKAPSLVIIAGGSGSGKTTLALALAERHPDWTVVHLDNYQRPTAHIPKIGRWTNWDHPNAIDFNALIFDLKALMRGLEIRVKVRSQETQTNRFHTETLRPGPIILLEGFLALWHPGIREMASYSIFLEAPHDVRMQRRRWKKNPAYVEKVYLPMFQEHLEPTKVHASVVLDTEERDADMLLRAVEFLLKPSL